MRGFGIRVGRPGFAMMAWDGDGDVKGLGVVYSDTKNLYPARIPHRTPFFAFPPLYVMNGESGFFHPISHETVS